jgi:hypothetical protein
MLMLRINENILLIAVYLHQLAVIQWYYCDEDLHVTRSAK